MKPQIITRNGRVIGEIVMGRFCKFAVNESKHLLWGDGRGGVPAIDAQAWDKVKSGISEIYIRTDKRRRFRVKTAVFEQNKKTLDYGFGKQYWIDKGLWDIVQMRRDEMPEHSIDIGATEVIPSQDKML